jgi:hypothetical protein
VQYNAGTSFEEAKREIGRDHIKKKIFARYDNLWKGRESILDPAELITRTGMLR